MRYQLADERGADAMTSYRNAAKHIDIPGGMRLMYAAAAVDEKKYDEAENTYAEMIHQVNPEPSADRFRHRHAIQKFIELR